MLNNLGKIYLDQEKHARAWETYQSADAQYVEAFGEAVSSRLPPLLGMAKASAEMGNHADALGEFRQAVEVSMESNSPQRAARVATYLAEYLLERGDCSAGEDLLRQSLEASRIEAGSSLGFKKLEEQMVACGFSPDGEPGAGALLGS